MSESISSRQKGNKFFKHAIADGVAPALKIERFQRALSCYHKALNDSANDEEASSACKNILVSSHYLSKVYLSRNDINQYLYHSKECLSYGYEAINKGGTVMGKDWIDNVQARTEIVVTETLDHVIDTMERDNRIRFLHRFSSIINSKQQQIRLLKHLVKDTFHTSVVALEDNKYKESLNSLAEIYSPLTRLEDFQSLDTSDGYTDQHLIEFIKIMKEDVFKSQCISESLQKRCIADKLLADTINDAESVDFTAIWQVIDLYKESILLTRENDVEQEAISLSKLGNVYHKVLLLKERAKDAFMRVIQLAQSLQPRNLSAEKWFKDASAVLAVYQIEKQKQEDIERQKARKKYIDEMKEQLTVLKEKSNLSVQGFLVWIYTEHPPKHVSSFSIDLKEIAKAPGDTLKKLLSKAIVFYHPDKINDKDYGMKYKIFSEEIVKYLTVKYEQMK